MLLVFMLIHLGHLYPRNDMNNCKLLTNDYILILHGTISFNITFFISYKLDVRSANSRRTIFSPNLELLSISVWDAVFRGLTPPP